MRSRLMGLILLAAVTLMVGGLWLARGEGLVGQERAEQGESRSSERGERKRDQRARNQRGKDAALLKPGQKSLAFDVSRKDYRAASGYVLEITDAAGVVTTHDLKKPRQRRGTISVPLPELKPGKYQVVVVAENPAGKTRSAPLQVEIR